MAFIQSSAASPRTTPSPLFPSLPSPANQPGELYPKLELYRQVARACAVRADQPLLAVPDHLHSSSPLSRPLSLCPLPLFPPDATYLPAYLPTCSTYLAYLLPRLPTTLPTYYLAYHLAYLAYLPTTLPARLTHHHHHRTTNNSRSPPSPPETLSSTCLAPSQLPPSQAHERERAPPPTSTLFRSIDAAAHFDPLRPSLDPLPFSPPPPPGPSLVSSIRPRPNHGRSHGLVQARGPGRWRRRQDGPHHPAVLATLCRDCEYLATSQPRTS